MVLHRIFVLFCFLSLFSCDRSEKNLKNKKINYTPQKIQAKDLSNSEESHLRVLSFYPLAAETKMHSLDDEITPTHKLYVRNNGHVPPLAYEKDFSKWSLKVDGAVHKTYNFSLKELKKKFKTYEYQIVLECGGNGRAGFNPPGRGSQWSYGAVGAPLWKGVLLKDVLKSLGVKDSAVYVAYEGHDIHLSRDLNKKAISRGIPIKKALDPMTLLAFEMNRRPLTAEHGAPLRLVVPGYPGSASGKWLKRLWVRTKVHDGAKMGGSSYRLPPYPVKPGTDIPVTEKWKIIEKMPVKSLITFPKSGLSTKKRELEVRGFAWTSAQKIIAVDVSCDYGQTWSKAHLSEALNPYAWQRWKVKLKFPGKGYYEIWARAKDSNGKMQPMVVGNWNPKGYLNNAMPRIAVQIS